MKTIKFSENWNGKLDCDIFTTIRKYSEGKEKYYLESTGNCFKVLLNGSIKCVAKLVKIEYDIFPLKKVLLQLDTGIEDYTEILKLFRKFGIKQKDKVLLLTFKRRKENDDNNDE